MNKETTPYNKGLNAAFETERPENPFELWSEDWEDFEHGVLDAARLFADNFR